MSVLFKRRRGWHSSASKSAPLPLRGCIDGLEGCVLSGWFISPSCANEHNEFVLRLDGKGLGRYSATEPRHDVLEAEGVLDCGFSCDISSALETLPRGKFELHDGELHVMQLWSIDGELATEFEVRGDDPRRGFLDRVDAGGLAGWAVNDAHPNEPVNLSIFIDDVPFLDFATSELRNDLIAKKIPGAVAGFSVNWPKGLIPKGTKIDVRFNGGSSLNKSPSVVRESTNFTSHETSSYLDQWKAGNVCPVTVVVPVFNARDAVEDCLESLKLHLPCWAEVLVIDDCSTDDGMREYLQSWRNQPRFRVERNSSNLGYTRTVNLGISLAGERDVVLLNSDTAVTERWLENLRYCAYARPRVATVTALSNNAGAFSTPEIGIQNTVPEHMSRVLYAAVVSNAGTGRTIEVPTGNGFCLYIRRRAIDDIGVFDEAKYPRGYGEENDLCMRALRRGWLNLVSDKAYVFHKRSQSFQEEKTELMRLGGLQVKADYPEYSMLIRRFRDGEFCRIRHLARSALTNPNPENALPGLLYVISTQTGGTPQTNLDLMREMAGRYKCYLLRSDANKLFLHRLEGSELAHLETHELSAPIDPVHHRSDEYDRIVLDMMYRHGIRLVHIRHIGWHSLGLAEAAKSLEIPVVYSLHDFYSVCPSLNLLDQDFKYCGGTCTAGAGTCQIALWSPEKLPPLKHAFVFRWRQMFDEFLSHCDQLITTSRSVVETFSAAFPQHAGRVAVIPHGRTFAELSSVRNLPGPRTRIRVLVPGNISLSKGAALLKEMAELDVEGRFELHFLGTRWKGLHGVGVDHGPYTREDFQRKVAEIAPHIGVVLSLCPETYCHTLTEMWACGVPVLGLNVGAVGERIGSHRGGWLVPVEATAGQILDALETAVSDTQRYDERIATVHAWQRTEAMRNDTATMAAEYRCVYQRLLNATTPVTKVALVLKGQTLHPPTAFIRLIGPTMNCRPANGLDVRSVTPAWLIAGGASTVSKVVIQRDAVPAALAGRLIEVLDESCVPYIYEIDDALWELPPEHRDHAIDEEARNAILALIQNASVVTTSTAALARRLQHLGAANVEVIVNAPERSWWLAPLQAEQTADQPISVLYMGTASHASDLEMIAPAIEELRRLHPEIEVVQIGGGVLLPGARELHVPAKARGHYPTFVSWFRQMAAQCTFALAPLAESTFNNAKSDIKSLDYGMARIPAIYSDVPPYRGALTDGEHGILVPNVTSAWVQAMNRMIEDPSVRASIAEGAYARAWARMAESEATSAWLHLLSADHQPGERSVSDGVVLATV